MIFGQTFCRTTFSHICWNNLLSQITNCTCIKFIPETNQTVLVSPVKRRSVIIPLCFCSAHLFLILHFPFSKCILDFSLFFLLLCSRFINHVFCLAASPHFNWLSLRRSVHTRQVSLSFKRNHCF